MAITGDARRIVKQQAGSSKRPSKRSGKPWELGACACNCNLNWEDPS